MEHVAGAHVKGGIYLKDAIYGANDGIVTTFAVVAGVTGASLEHNIIILLGLASLLADGFSMAASNYLGSKSEHAYTVRERKIEEIELHTDPARERAEMQGYLQRKGYAKKDAEALLPLLSKNNEMWLDIMMLEELGISPPNANMQSIRAASATFFSFVLAGAIPLIPFLFTASEEVFGVASFFTASALFIIGAYRSLFTGQKWYVAGIEMLFIGGTAAVIAYAVGFLISGII
jgi:vacuolar iron transporter family protein